MIYYSDEQRQISIHENDENYHKMFSMFETPMPMEQEKGFTTYNYIIFPVSDNENSQRQDFFLEQLTPLDQLIPPLQLFTQINEDELNFQELTIKSSCLDDSMIIQTQIFDDLIQKVLQGIQPSDQEIQQLNDLQQELLNSIAQRNNSFDKKQNMDLKKIQKHNNKRKEEKQKFFFKKALKYLLSRFKASRQIHKNIKKKEKYCLDQQFYVHYFQDVAKKYGIKIENFLHPEKQIKLERNDQRGQNKYFIKGFKTFNQTHIQLVLESKSYKRDLKDYLTTRFYEECQRERSGKIHKIIEKLESEKNYNMQIIKNSSYNHICFINQEDKKNFVKKKVVDYIHNNPKCKLPWSDVDIMETYNFVINLVQNDNLIND